MIRDTDLRHLLQSNIMTGGMKNMTRIILRELYLDIRSMFRGWKLIFSLAFLGFIIIMYLMDDVGSIEYNLMLYSIIGTTLMKSKINKLYFLLPMERGDRKKYLVLKCLGILLYHVLLYFAVILLVTLHQDSNFAQEILVMLCYYIPVIIGCSSINIGSNYNWGRGRNKSIDEKYKRRNVYAILLVIVPMVNAVIRYIIYPEVKLQGIWLVVVTMLSYFLVLSSLLLQLSILRYTEISEENVRKVEKVF